MQKIPARRQSKKQKRSGQKEEQQRNVSERKLRKERRKKKDRRSKSRRRKESDEERQANRELALLIISYLPKKNSEHINNKFLCNCCHLYYCVGFDCTDVFCRECHYQLGYLKLASGAVKKCNYCERKEVGSEGQPTKH